MKIGVIGCSGRMGRNLCKEIIANPECELSGGTVRSSNKLLNKDIGFIVGSEELNVSAGDSMDQLFEASDAVIDFSSPELSIEAASKAAKYNKKLIIGTTGFDDDQLSKLKELSEKTCIIWSGNMSQGINILSSLVEKVASILDPSFDIEVVELHHNKKVDAPSGTALMLGESAAKGRNIALKDYECKSRNGIIGARKEGEIGFSTIRAGDIVGEHTVIIAGNGERLELTHKASDRKIFANGAVRAALWSANKNSGFYSMKDVLGTD